MVELSTAVVTRPVDQIVMDDPEAVVRTLVGRLRERRAGGLRDALSDLLADRDRRLGGILSPAAQKVISGFDDLMMTVLSTRYDALDAALVDTTFAVAEIDGDGLISYANPALSQMVPNALGAEFAMLFGSRSDDVRQAMASGRRETLWLDLEQGNLPSIHMRGEIGPLTDEFGRKGAYALLLNVNDEEARFNATPYGVLRLDPKGKVIFANSCALKMFGGSERLAGRPLKKLFEVDGSPGNPGNVADWLVPATGFDTTAYLVPLGGGNRLPVRVAVVPSFENTGARAGTLLTVRPRTKELALAEINRLVGALDLKPESLAEGVMKAIQPVVPFDFATFSVFTDEMSYSRTVAMYPIPQWEWTTAWFKLGPGVHEFLLRGETWGSNLEQAVEDYSPDLVDNDVVHNVTVREGMKGYLSLPIMGGADNVRAVVTLLSKNPKAYGPADRQQLVDLGVDQALLIAETSITRRRRARMREMETKLAAAFDYRGLARALTDGIASCFDWENVALYAVDRQVDREGDRRFRLISQSGSPDVAAAAVDDTMQPRTLELLAKVLQTNTPQDEPCIRPGQANDPDEKPRARSAWAAPLQVVKRAGPPDPSQIEWILLIESSMHEAFHGPDMGVLREVLDKCETILRQRWERAVQHSLLGAAEQAIVVVDRAGTIQLTNARADNLLCGAGDLVGTSLASLGNTETDRRLIQSAEQISQTRLRLRAGEATRTVLATQRPIHDDYEHRLWLFTDLREIDWQADGRYLEQTVTEVAQTARLPLMLAKSMLREVARLPEKPAAARLNEAIRQLGKADITYERLANTLSIRQGPDQPRQQLDVIDLLLQTIRGLPSEDSEHCDIRGTAGSIPKRFMVLGWPDQLGFAFRSMLGYLILHRRPESELRILLRASIPGEGRETLKIIMSVPTTAGREWLGSPSASDPLAAAERQARDLAELAPETIKLVIARHDGTFSTSARTRQTLTFTIELPASPLGSGATES